MKPIIIKGGQFTDARGILHFVNEENPGYYRRFYLITQTDKNIVRAWQGHKQEEKGFYALKGAFTIAVVQPAIFDLPAENEQVEFFELNDQNNYFLRVPGGCYTGIKAQIDNSTLLVLSSFDFAGSKSDDYRQPAKRWVNWAQ